MAKTAFRVVTDSTADLPKAWAEKYGIETVPLKVLFGNESFRDRVDLTDDQFYARLGQAEKLPTTSAPSPGDFAEVYRKLSTECDGVISIHLGSNVSATVEAARIGASSVEGFRVDVIDSRSVTMPIAFLCRVAAESPTLEEAVRRVNERVGKCRVLALLDTLRYVSMGGRIGRAAYLLGSMLDVKVILRVAGGPVESVDRIRTRSKGIVLMLDHFRKDLPVEYLGIVHSQAPEDAEALRQTLLEELPGQEIEIGEIGAVLGTHTGPKALAVVYIRK